MAKKYELLKNTNGFENIPKGAVAIEMDQDELEVWLRGRKFYKVNGFDTLLEQSEVEDKDFFSEVVEKEFVWNDDLVMDYLLWRGNISVAHLSETEKIKIFKKPSNQPTAYDVLNSGGGGGGQSTYDGGKYRPYLGDEIGQWVTPKPRLQTTTIQNENTPHTFTGDKKEMVEISFVIKQGIGSLRFDETVLVYNVKEVTSSEVMEIRRSIQKILNHDFPYNVKSKNKTNEI